MTACAAYHIMKNADGLKKAYLYKIKGTVFYEKQNCQDCGVLPFLHLGAACLRGCGARDAVLTEIEQLDETQQADVVFVTIQHEDGTGCDFYAYRRESGGLTLAWQTEGYVGRSGVADPTNRRAGDGTTPAGIYSLGECFGIYPAPDNMTLPYTMVDEDDYWDGDSSSPTYNQHVKGSEMPDSWDASSSEHLIEYTISYNYCAMINFNVEPAVRGRAPAFFFTARIRAPRARRAVSRYRKNI